MMTLETAKWIWCEEERPNTYCCARGELLLVAPPVSGLIHLFADSRYQCWVNGHYVGQGPTPFRKPHIYIDTFDITRHLHPGRNVIAILGNYHGVKHCTYSIGKPGIIAKVEVIDTDASRRECVTGEQWKIHQLDAYLQDVPRRTGATAWMEVYDARKEPVGWRENSFDDSTWSCARIVDPGPLKMYPRIVPMLREYPSPFTSVQGFWQAPSPAPSLDALTAHLDTEPLVPLTEITSKFPLVLTAAMQGTAFCLDFGKEFTGQIELDITAPSGVTIDLCPTENLRDGRPWCYRKGGNYGRRYITRSGRQQFRYFGYDGIRYIHIVVRGPHPEITFHHLGVWRRETALPIRAKFECDNPIVNRIWDITCHTMTIGAQEVHIDCPTREQTSAWGDHVWSGLWEVYFTGDSSHLRHLMLSAEQIQWPCGQVNCYPFSAADIFPLYDYSFICIMGMQVYLQVTGDGDLPRRLIPVADRILDWYRKKTGPSGLIEMDCQKAIETNTGQLFIDHPGLNSHNHPYPPLDRRGISAGLNFFFVLALEALAKIHTYLGEAEKARMLQSEAASIRSAAEALFYDPDKQVYVDAFRNNRRSNCISQQTNALAVLSGTCPPERAQKVLTRILDTANPNLCQCGTYFWTYLADALCQTGMHREMWTHVVRLWNEMAENGATAWWETFLGDHLDSLCHIWSCVPGYLILAEILGIKPARPGFSKIDIHPRLDLLNQAKAGIPIAGGKIEIEWQKVSENKRQLRIANDTDSPATLRLPQGWIMHETLEILPRSTLSFICRKN